jgi:hypothetical protein
MAVKKQKNITSYTNHLNINWIQNKKTSAILRQRFYHVFMLFMLP